MSLNLAKLLNEILEGIVFYAYAHGRAICILVRHPFRGPKYLAYKNLRSPDHTVSPNAFLLINIFVSLYFLNFAFPLIFVFWEPRFLGPALSTAIDQFRNAEVDFWPIIVRGLVVFMSLYFFIDLTTSSLIKRTRTRNLVRNSLLFSYGLQPLAVIVAFAYITRFDLMNSRHELLISASTVTLVAAIALLAVVNAERTWKPYISVGGVRASARAFVLAALFLVAAYAEAIFLLKWSVLDEPDGLVVSAKTCRVLDQKMATAEAFVRNPTKHQIVASINGLSLSVDGQSVKSDPVSSSSGKDAPFLIVGSGGTGWFSVKADLTLLPQPGKNSATCSLQIPSDFVMKEPDRLN